MRRFILELEVDERIIEAGTTPAGLLHDLSDELADSYTNSWQQKSGKVKCTGEGINLPEDIEDIQETEHNGNNWPVLYAWKLKEVE